MAPTGRLCKQRDLAYEMLNQIPGVSVVKPKGALYMFPKLDPKMYPIADDQQIIRTRCHDQPLDLDPRERLERRPGRSAALRAMAVHRVAERVVHRIRRGSAIATAPQQHQFTFATALSTGPISALMTRSAM